MSNAVSTYSVLRTVHDDEGWMLDMFWAWELWCMVGCLRDELNTYGHFSLLKSESLQTGARSVWLAGTDQSSRRRRCWVSLHAPAISELDVSVKNTRVVSLMIPMISAGIICLFRDEETSLHVRKSNRLTQISTWSVGEKRVRWLTEQRTVRTITMG